MTTIIGCPDFGFMRVLYMCGKCLSRALHFLNLFILQKLIHLMR